MNKTPLLLAAALLLSACERVEPGSSVAARDLPSITTDTGVEMVRIPGGEFVMGSSSGNADEQPAHPVKIAPFLMDRTEVTQEYFDTLVKQELLDFPNPSKVKDPKHPVHMLTWAQAAMVCNARSRAEKLDPCYDEETAECDFSKNGYRLPTEAEWEYACRAGSTTDYSFGSSARKLREYGWFAENSGKITHPVGLKKPNPWGLYDMHGNIGEWTNDIYSKTYYKNSAADNPRGPKEGEQYVVRGGSWKASADVLRSAYRVADNPGFSDACLAPDTLGLRCVRLAPAEPPKQEEAGEKGAAGKQAAAPTGYVYGDIYLEHDTGRGFPERPDRLRAINRGLKDAGLLEKLTRIEPRPASTDWIASVHSREYIDHVKAECGKLGKKLTRLDGIGDMPISARSYDVALAAVGGILEAVDRVMDGKIRNAYCAVRPPGHHALKGRAMGFCLFNNVAIAARYVQKKHGLKKVLIVDWDVHHGNATQDMFYEDASILFYSTHLHPFYPGTGGAEHRGKGEGSGTNINVPLKPGDGDAVLKKSFTEVLKPAALKFKPDFVFISCGFDSHENDQLGRLAITSKGFGELTRIVKDIAETTAKGRLVSMLEGGYTLDNLASASAAHVKVLME